MGRIKRSWRLMIASLKLLSKSPRLLVFPLASGVMVLVLIVGLVGGGAGLFAWHLDRSEAAGAAAPEAPAAFEEAGGEGGRSPAWYSHGIFGVLGIAAALTVYLACSFIAILFNSALVACVLLDLEGKPARLRDGLRLAWARRGAIFSWALLYSIVGVVLNMLQERARYIPFLGYFFFRMVGAAWSLVTFLIVPVIIFEDLPGLKARLKRSVELFKRTWGEQITGRIGVGGAVTVAVLLCVLLLGAVAVGLGVVLPQDYFPALMIGALAGLLLLLAVALLASTALNGIYTGVLYSYAVTGMLPKEFSPELLPRPGKV